MVVYSANESNWASVTLCDVSFMAFFNKCALAAFSGKEI